MKCRLAFLLLAVAASCRTVGAVNVWIDTDPSIGSPVREVDDAYALLLAFHSTEIGIEGVSTTYGNASVKRTTAVARILARRFGREARITKASVYAGARSAQDLGQITAATDALASRLERGGKLTYIAIGPLTNLATFVRLHPQLTRRIERVIFLGGRSPEARLAFGPHRFRIHDANVFKDQVAAQIVLKSHIPLLLVPIETASYLMLRRNELRSMRGDGGAGEYLFANSKVWMWFWTRIVQTEGAPVFDVSAVIAAAQPGSVRIESRYAEVSGAGDLIVSERRSSPGQTRVEWCRDLRPSAKLLLLKRLRSPRPERGASNSDQ